MFQRLLLLTSVLSAATLLGQTISPSTLPAGTRTGSYPTTQFTITGGFNGTWDISAGTLPTGLTLNTSGQLSGTISSGATLGANNFTVRFTGFSAGPPPVFTANLSINVNAAPTLSLVSPGATLPTATANVFYSQNVTSFFNISGGTPPFTFVQQPNFPLGLSTTNNIMSGVVRLTPQSTSVNFTVSDANGVQSAPVPIPITIAANALALNPATLPNWTVGRPYSNLVSGDAGIGYYRYNITSGSTPPGLVLDERLACPDLSGNLNLGASTSAWASLVGGVGTVTFSSPDVVAPMTLSPAGRLSGTPNLIGTTTYRLEARDSQGFGVYRDCSYSVFAAAGSTPSRACPANTAVIGSYYSSGPRIQNQTQPSLYSISGSLPAGLTLNANTGQISGTPTGNAATTNYTLVLQFAAATETLDCSITTQTSPSVLTIRDSSVRGTPSLIGTFNFAAAVYDEASGLATRNYAITINAAPVFSTFLLPAGTVGQAYSSSNITNARLNGTAPFNFTLASGALPPGITLSSAGALSGTPTQAGTYNFTVQVTDLAGATASTTNLTLTINAPVGPVLQITTNSLPIGINGVPYPNTQLAATGGTGTGYSFNTSGLPFNLTLSSSGVISGIPSDTFNGNVLFNLTDSGSNQASANIPLTIVDYFCPDPVAFLNFSYSSSVSLNNFVPVSFQIGGTLPPGLTFNTSTGAFTGTATQAGSYSLNITALDSLARSVTRACSINVQSVIQTSAPRTTGRVGIAYTSHIGAVGGASPYTHSVVAGTLPAGLTLESGTGRISGVPSAAGIFSYRVRTTDALSRFNERDFLLNVLSRADAPALRCPVPGAIEGDAYSSSVGLNASGNTTFSFLGASIPGLSFDPSTGRLSGTPSSSGTYNFTITANNSTAGPVSASCSLNVSESNTAPLRIACPDQTDFVVGESYISPAIATGGRLPYSYQFVNSSLLVSPGALSNGLTIDSLPGNVSGTLSSLPPGSTFSYSVRVTDAFGDVTTSSVCSNTVQPPSPLSILTQSLPPGLIGSNYNVPISTSGGVAPFTVQIQNGSLPPGLQVLSNANGIRITGTPLTVGLFSFRLIVNDNSAQSANRDFTIAISQADPLRFLTSFLNGATVGTPFAQSLEATGGAPPYRFAQTGGNPAPGITLSPGGFLAGNPTTAGNFRYEVDVTDAAGGRVSASYSLAVFQGNFRLGCPAAQAEIGVPYSSAANVLGGSQPYLFSIAAGTLPPGLALDTASGAISGRPTNSGVFSFTFGVSDARQNRTQTQCSIGVVGGPLRILTEGPLTSRAGEDYTAQLDAAGGSAPYTWSLLSSAPEAGITVATTGAITGRATRRGTFNFAVQVRDNAGATATRTLSLNAGDSTLSLACPAETRFQLGVPATGRFGLSGGVAPYRVNLFQGALPQGFTLNPDGSFSVTALESGNFPVQLQAADATATSVTTRCTFEVTGQPLTITTTALPEGTVGTPYSAGVSTSGAVGQVRFGLTSGGLPSGLNLDPNSGSLSGTPEQDGNFSVGVTATDSLRRNTSRALPLAITAGRLPFRITTASPLSDGFVGIPYSGGFSADGGRAPITFTISGLPAGLTASGESFSGTPTAAGDANVEVIARDATGATASKSFLLRIKGDGLFITTPSLPDGVTGEPYSAGLEAQGGRPPLTWSILSGGVPPGLSFNPTTGSFEGTLTDNGPFFVSVEVADASGATSRRSYTFEVRPAGVERLSITTASLPPASAGIAYSTALGATGGREPYIWSLNGSLPAGLSLAPDGSITGTPTTIGTATFAVVVRDALGFTVSRVLSLEVRADRVPSLSIEGLPDSANSNQNLPFTVRIGSPFSLAINARLTLSFTGDSIHNADDPNIRFGNNSRTIEVTIPAGATSVTIPAAAATISTGTLAGTIRLDSSLSFAGATAAGPNRSVLVRRAAPTITNLRLTRTSGGLEIRIEGFTNTRQLSEARITFTASGSVDLTTSSATVNVAQAINAWFASAAAAQFGGQFALTLPFTVSGDAANITGVSVTIVNGEGASAASNAN